MICGLRSGFANIDHLPFYMQVSLGVSREFQLPEARPTTLRLDVIQTL